MIDKVKIYAIAGCVLAVGIALYGIYSWGYSVAEAEAELAMETLKTEKAMAILKAQEEEKVKYEKRIQDLVADIERLRANDAEWLLKQDAFIGAERTLDACMRERSELTRLAVEGRKLLDEASIRFKFCAKQGS